MALEQVLSERDSEDEVDDDVADFEDRRVHLMISRLIHLFLFLFLNSQLFVLFEQQSSSCT